MPYRLYNHKAKRFMGPVETRAAVWKRLSAITNRVRNPAMDMMRLNCGPVEVLAENPGILTTKSREELRELFRARRMCR